MCLGLTVAMEYEVGNQGFGSQSRPKSRRTRDLISSRLMSTVNCSSRFLGDSDFVFYLEQHTQPRQLESLPREYHKSLWCEADGVDTLSVSASASASASAAVICYTGYVGYAGHAGMACVC